MYRSAVAYVMLCITSLMTGQGLAPTPPMGWNSWDSYGMTITQPEFEQNARWFAVHLRPFGWQYLVVDEGWYLAHPENGGIRATEEGYVLDDNGRYIPAVNRFPSSDGKRGFRPLATYVHSLGLKFGIHIIRGIPKQAVERNVLIANSHYHAVDAANRSDTCAWNSDNYGVKDNRAGRAYYDSIAKLYASWGIDFVKVDCIARPYQAFEIHMISSALRKTGRPIVLSVSPGPTPLRDAADVKRQTQMWRISDDLWDIWNSSKEFPESVIGQFALLSQWEQYAGHGHWPDADMLPFGWLGPRPGVGRARDSRLNRDEMQTVVTLWSIARSPLIIGANLTKMDSATEQLFTNPEVIEVDQHSSNNRSVICTSQVWVWSARAELHKGAYVAMFNLSDESRSLNYTWQRLGFGTRNHMVRNLWARTDRGSEGGIAVTLRPHASALYLVR